MAIQAGREGERERGGKDSQPVKERKSAEREKDMEIDFFDVGKYIC